MSCTKSSPQLPPKNTRVQKKKKKCSEYTSMNDKTNRKWGKALIVCRQHELKMDVIYWRLIKISAPQQGVKVLGGQSLSFCPQRKCPRSAGFVGCILQPAGHMSILQDSSASSQSSTQPVKANTQFRIVWWISFVTKKGWNYRCFFVTFSKLRFIQLSSEYPKLMLMSLSSLSRLIHF